MFDMVDWEAFRREQAEKAEQERQSRWYRRFGRWLSSFLSDEDANAIVSRRFT